MEQPPQSKISIGIRWSAHEDSAFAQQASCDLAVPGSHRPLHGAQVFFSEPTGRCFAQAIEHDLSQRAGSASSDPRT